MNGQLELRHLRALLAVVDHGGHTRAARALGMSQSSVSETLLALERVVGAPVLERRRSGPPRLTPAGEALIDPARRIVALADETVARVDALTGAARLRIAVGANESVSSYLLPPALAALRRDRPSAEVQVSMGLCEEIRAGVRAGELDLGLVIEPERAARRPVPRPPGERVVRPVSVTLFGAAGHPLAGRRVALDVLWETTFYISDAAGAYTAALRQALAGAGVAAPRVVAVGSVEGVKRAVLEGDRQGVGMLPSFAIAAEERSGALRSLRIEPPLPGFSLVALFREAAAPAAEALLEALASR
jgi:molybdate transport repressor ModE-like protein